MLVCNRGGLKILDASDGALLKCLDLGDHGIAVESYKETVVVAVNNENNLKVDIVTLDRDYEEIQRWSARPGACDFTILDDKVFITRQGLSNGIKVYSLDGAELKSQEIIWNGEIIGISAIFPSSIVFGDQSQHRVYKRRTTRDQRHDEWSIDMKVPRCLCIDANGLIWVRSNKNDCLAILRRDGESEIKLVTNC